MSFHSTAMRTRLRHAATMFICCWACAATSSLRAGIYSMLNSMPPSEQPMVEVPAETFMMVPQPDAMDQAPEAASEPTSEPTYVQSPYHTILSGAEYLGRGAVVADDTRLADFASGSFLPSAIPVAGQPFFGTGWRANAQGSGSAVRISGYLPAVDASGHAELALRELATSQTDGEDATLAVRQAFVRWNRLCVGVMESAFADQSALAETLDLAGPNSRVSIYDAGIGDGQARISYDMISDEPNGFEITGSIEQAIPEIEPLPDDATVARYPDFIWTMKYVDGEPHDDHADEWWHIQWATVFRDLGLESPDGSNQNVFGWGTALSGAYRFSLNPESSMFDRVVVSAVYGKGISHYVTDLNAATDTGDAVVNSAATLEALPVFGWYTGYTHNWTNRLQSSATYSQVHLDSTPALVAAASPYRRGDYVAINLVYHVAFQNADDNAKGIYTGIEYLFGRKETLDDSTGDAQRIMFVVAIWK